MSTAKSHDAFIAYSNLLWGKLIEQAFDAYVVGKEDAPGIVVLQEWWGVDFEVKNHALKISQFDSGYKALIPE